MAERSSATLEELWEMVKVFSQHSAELEEKLRAVNEAAGLEGANWLKIYQDHLAEISGLKFELTRLESRVRELQGGS